MNAGRDGIDANRGDPSQPRRIVRRRNSRVRVQPRTFGGTRDLRVGRDVLALAEERFVQLPLERAKVAEVIRPETRRERQRRARLKTREVDLDSPCLRVSVDVVRPIGAEVVAARREQRPRSRAKLERQPLHVDQAGILGRLGGA